MKKVKAAFFAALLLGVLAGCGLDIPLGQGQYYRVNLEPDQWGFEVDSSGVIKIAGNLAQVIVAPGAPAGILESVDVTYYDGSGNLVVANDPGYSGSIAVAIPEGIVCADDTASCTKAVADWEYGWAKSETFNFSMQGKIAREMLDDYVSGDPILGWYAHVVFHARTTSGKPVQWEQDINIIYPLASE